jgi:Coenzyme PQQ synthesis protein D (PqqD)
MRTTPESLRSVHTADGGIVLDVAKNKMFSLNSSASAIFQLLERGLPEHRIVEEIAQRFSISVEAARADVADFCRSLRGNALLAPPANSAPE